MFETCTTVCTFNSPLEIIKFHVFFNIHDIIEYSLIFTIFLEFLKIRDISGSRAAALRSSARRAHRALVDRRKLRRKAVLAHGALIRARTRALACAARSARSNAPLARARRAPRKCTFSRIPQPAAIPYRSRSANDPIHIYMYIYICMYIHMYIYI